MFHSNTTHSRKECILGVAVSLSYNANWRRNIKPIATRQSDQQDLNMGYVRDQGEQSKTFEENLKEIVLGGPFNGRDYQPRADAWLKYWERKNAKTTQR